MQINPTPSSNLQTSPYTLQLNVSNQEQCFCTQSSHISPSKRRYRNRTMNMTKSSRLPDFKFFTTKTIPSGENQSHHSTVDEKIQLRTSQNSSARETFWTHCGPLLNLNDLPKTFHTWSRATFSTSPLPTLIPFLNFVHSFLRQEGLTHYWLTIRATHGTTDFDMPRWHTDDQFFADTKNRWLSKHNDHEWKLCTTLLGPGTLFLSDGTSARKALRQAKATAQQENQHVCTSVRCLGCATTAEVVRERLAVKFAESEFEIAQAGKGECIYLRLGGDNGAVHSEPPCHGPRVFVNVVPGTEEELRGLMAKWGMEFPRSWSMGVPICFESEK